MARGPLPGRCKTRLAAHLGGEDAAELYAALLADTLTRLEGALRDAAVPGRLFVCGGPSEADREALRARVASPWTLRAQVGDDLEQRLCHATRTLFEEGHTAVVLSGADAPTLPASALAAQLPWLTEGPQRLLLGPAEDGGYTLLGLSRDAPALFIGVPFSTARVREETLLRARAEGFATKLLPLGRDVDELDDLLALGRHLDREPEAAPHTARWLRAQGPRWSPPLGE